MTKFAPAASVFSVLCLLGLSAPAQAVTIINGSFEDGHNAPSGNYVTLGSGSTDITGWTVGGAGIDWINQYWTASDGNLSLDLSGNGPGSIEQLLTGLTIGQTYAVSFDMAGNNDGGSTVKQLTADPGSWVFYFDVTGTDNTNMNWTTKTFNFTANSTSVNLKFMSDETNPFGPALDNVRISAVPLPAALPLFGGAIGALVMSGRRKKRLVAAT